MPLFPATAAVHQLAAHVAQGLADSCTELGDRWLTQARAVAPRPSGAVVAGDAERNARLCLAVAATLRGESRCKDEVMRIGWELGTHAYTTNTSLQYLLKEMELLASIVLYAAQRLAGDVAGATAVEGIAVARALARALALAGLAASKGFMHGYDGAIQQRYRTLRHDLRNPLGTIRGAVSLMEDPSVSPEMRNDPRFRTMVVRNTNALESLIGDRLSDAASVAPTFARHDVSLRDVALAVRRDLRDEATEAGCAVEVDADLPVVRTDSSSFELALRSIVGGAICAAAPGTTVHVGLRALGDRAATVAVAIDGERAGTGDDLLGFARELSALTGGRVWAEGGALCLEVPVSAPAEPAHDRPRAD